MSLTIRSFLNLLKTTPVTANTVRIVCGNESADLDSVASAISYAYLSYIHNDSDPQPIIPVINIPREDLRLRRDIVHVLRDVNVSEDLLFFLEDMREWHGAQKTINAVLVDHNEVVNEAKKYVSKVVGVVDHHKDMKLYLDAQPRIIQVCGSCSSLVFKHFMEDVFSAGFKPSPDVVQLCLAAGLVDTTNFTHRVEQPDLDCREMYSTLIPDVSMQTYTKTIKNAKNDISGFTARDLLRKDYKQFEFANERGVHGGKLVMGISSIVKPMEWLYEEFNGLTRFKASCVAYREEKNIDILTIMTSFVDNGAFKRQITMIPSDSTKEIAQSILDNTAEYLKLERQDIRTLSNSAETLDPAEYQEFEQCNIDASRKQVAPYLQKAFSDM
ncbi:exopolyphosphatase [Maudiozyma humilis]|uniref:Exopolyphosphatase n=1 Tax=Maudiozyma humilis TaxID=51915 RepID=A0AAV5RT15_MAUHU|nr:exopolyphosphatase [Kazachstania humilis]